MLSSVIRQALEKQLTEEFKTRLKLLQVSTLHGGSVNSSYHLETTIGDFFVKLNSKEHYPGMFNCEVNGLEALRINAKLRIPKVHLNSEIEDRSFLVLEYIGESKPNEQSWTKMGEGLAELHRKTSTHFGFIEDNYIGSLFQANPQTNDWPSFFGEHRLLAQAKLAYQNKRIDQKVLRDLELLAGKLNTLFPEESPSLLHGDLWSGNFLIDQEAQPVLIDPAVYYGHREMDLAMSHLFGGFHAQFYRAYNESYPLASGWEKRIDLCNLYPLLVHVNLFGASYAKRLKSTLKKYL